MDISAPRQFENDDIDLIAAAQAGCRASFDELYRKYRGPLLGYCTRLVGDPDAADDIVQETFLRTWRGMDRIDPQRRLWPWLQRVSQRICLDHETRNPMKAATGDELAGARVVGLAPLAAADGSSTENEALASALGSLNPRYRRLLYLRAIEGWSYRDLARADGTSVSSVGKVLARAKERVRLQLERSTAALGLAPLMISLRYARDRVRARLASVSFDPTFGIAGVRVTEQFAIAVAGLVIVSTLFGGSAVARADLDLSRDSRVIGQDQSRQPSVERMLRAGDEVSRRIVTTPVGDATVEMGNPKTGGVDPTGGHLRIEVRDTEGETLWFYEAEQSCDNGEMTPQDAVVSVSC